MPELRVTHYERIACPWHAECLDLGPVVADPSDAEDALTRLDQLLASGGYHFVCFCEANLLPKPRQRDVLDRLGLEPSHYGVVTLRRVSRQSSAPPDQPSVGAQLGGGQEVAGAPD